MTHILTEEEFLSLRQDEGEGGLLKWYKVGTDLNYVIIKDPDSDLHFFLNDQENSSPLEEKERQLYQIYLADHTEPDEGEQDAEKVRA